jgi:hypothetical protein
MAQNISLGVGVISLQSKKLKLKFEEFGLLLS